MNAILPPRWLCALLALGSLCLSAGGASGPASPLSLTVDSASGEAEVDFRGFPLLVYTFARTQCGPHLHELYSLSGANVLGDPAADHPRRDDLPYATRIGGADSWGTRGAAGRERHVRWLGCETGTDRAGRSTATLVEELHWITDQDAVLADTAAAALLTETRTLRVSVDEKTGEVSIDWQDDFEAGPGAERVQLHGRRGNPLCVQFADIWTRVAVRDSSSRTPVATCARRDAAAARWTSTIRAPDGRATALAFLGSTAIVRGGARVLTELLPDREFNAAQEPVEYTRGERWSVRCQLTICSGKRTREFLTAHWQESRGGLSATR